MGGTQGPQLSRLVSAVGAEKEGVGVTTCVAVISEDTSAVPSVNVCQCVILPTTGVWRKKCLRHVRRVARGCEKTTNASLNSVLCTRHELYESSTRLWLRISCV